MLVNGVGQNEAKASYASKTRFLSKFTFPYYGEITVRNYLILAAFMRMSRTTDKAAKFERVEQIISEVCSMRGKVKPVYEASGPSGQSLSRFQQHEATRSISTPSWIGC